MTNPSTTQGGGAAEKAAPDCAPESAAMLSPEREGGAAPSLPPPGGVATLSVLDAQHAVEAAIRDLHMAVFASGADPMTTRLPIIASDLRNLARALDGLAGLTRNAA